jgi:hypothetical protein
MILVLKINNQKRNKKRNKKKNLLVLMEIGLGILVIQIQLPKNNKLNLLLKNNRIISLIFDNFLSLKKI